MTIGLIVMIGAADFATGPTMSLAVFYLVPIGMCGWFMHRPWSVAAATLAGFLWYWDVHALVSQQADVLQLWSCVSRVGFFLIVAWMASALRSMYDHQRSLAETDDVTGLPNRRAFIAACEREIARAARARTPISAVFLDADHFKSVNDRFGHAAGDKLLRVVAETLTVCCRRSDFAARLGGDEFIVLLPDADMDGAVQVCEKFRRSLNEAMTAHRWPVTFSMGVATYTRPPFSPDEVIRKTDALQYAAKNGGRDTIVNELIAA